jgi:glyceraldehyde 3-phosphate dehydrogenase
MVKIAINGLGRIGRCILRAAAQSAWDDIEIVAANGPAAIEDHAHLLKYDSVHGVFTHDITIEGDIIKMGRHNIKILGERDPAKLPWKELGIDIVLECSGRFNSKLEAAQHIQAGASKVIVGAPCDDADAVIVFGVNNHVLTRDAEVISIGSCTTNALAPIAYLLDKLVGIESGFMTTIHSYTNDQNILDGSHKDRRRARSCAMSIIPTSTGAANAIGLVLPNLKGKIGGAAIRVPTPNVSMVDLAFTAGRATSKDEINQYIARAAIPGVVAVAPDKLVSVDFNHNPYSTIFDPFETHVINGNFCRVVSWYDNEWGFSNRMLDVTALFAKLMK